MSSSPTSRRSILSRGGLRERGSGKSEGRQHGQLLLKKSGAKEEDTSFGRREQDVPKGSSFLSITPHTLGTRGSRVVLQKRIRLLGVRREEGARSATRSMRVSSRPRHGFRRSCSSRKTSYQHALLGHPSGPLICMEQLRRLSCSCLLLYAGDFLRPPSINAPSPAPAPPLPLRADMKKEGWTND